ncbi:MAG: hypothetical protein Ct9H300mP11_24820 [Chloroflexota bacterium]|nr:MAG: hypothetical protein Ct9H300mP11_24820 [Chloroflexota bacterium]
MESSQYDVAIIGGGILGYLLPCSCWSEFPDGGWLSLKKEDGLANHQTGHNSGVMHSGIYYRPGSHKAQFCVAGLNNMVKFCEENEMNTSSAVRLSSL